MPGTVNLRLYEMLPQDALSILAVDDDTLLRFGATADVVAELRHAARVVVEQHAEDVVAHYAELHDARERSVLRLVHNGETNDGGQIRR